MFDSLKYQPTHWNYTVKNQNIHRALASCKQSALPLFLVGEWRAYLLQVPEHQPFLPDSPGWNPVLSVALAVLWKSPICMVVSNRGRALLWEMWPNMFFAAAMAAKYLIISNAHLWAAGSGTVLWAQKCKSLPQEIFLSTSQEWLHSVNRVWPSLPALVLR